MTLLLMGLPCGLPALQPTRQASGSRARRWAQRGSSHPFPTDQAFKILCARPLASSRRHKSALAVPACQTSADGLTRNPTAVRPTARSTGEGQMSAVRSIIGVTTVQPSPALPLGLLFLLLISP